jgi:hypothetical protein
MEKFISKICTKCNLDKPYADYHKSKRYADGKDKVCKWCIKANMVKLGHVKTCWINYSPELLAIAKENCRKIGYIIQRRKKGCLPRAEIHKAKRCHKEDTVEAICRTCNKMLPIEKFTVRGKYADGSLARRSVCKICRGQHIKKTYTRRSVEVPRSFYRYETEELNQLAKKNSSKINGIIKRNKMTDVYIKGTFNVNTDDILEYQDISPIMITLKRKQLILERKIRNHAKEKN